MLISELAQHNNVPWKKKMQERAEYMAIKKKAVEEQAKFTAIK
jgi:hypothetical protein